MTPRLFKMAEVCDIAQLQPYVLRSWEKEFPGIGVQKSEDTRLYRQSDIDQVLRIKQLVFGEGLTVSGARRRLEQTSGAAPPASVADAGPAIDEPIEIVDEDARQRIGFVREGLRSLLDLLDGGAQGPTAVPPSPPAPARERAAPARDMRRRASAERTKTATRSKPVAAARRTTAPPAARKGKRKRSAATR
jgi:DNA-binding transcriptional MerR regulator